MEQQFEWRPNSCRTPKASALGRHRDGSEAPTQDCMLYTLYIFYCKIIEPPTSISFLPLRFTKCAIGPHRTYTPDLLITAHRKLCGLIGCRIHLTILICYLHNFKHMHKMLMKFVQITHSSIQYICKTMLMVNYSYPYVYVWYVWYV